MVSVVPIMLLPAGMFFIAPARMDRASAIATQAAPKSV
jgi:hypothetical protein